MAASKLFIKDFLRSFDQVKKELTREQSERVLMTLLLDGDLLKYLGEENRLNPGNRGIHELRKVLLVSIQRGLY